jgi:hypothetical protein
MRRCRFQSITLVTCGLLFVPGVLGDCKCQRPGQTDTTRWGGNEVIVVVDEKSHRELRGKVVAPYDQLLENAFVEIFDKPEYLLAPGDNSRGNSEQKRLAVCRTGRDGKFCFRNLPSGTTSFAPALVLVGTLRT